MWAPLFLRQWVKVQAVKSPNCWIIFMHIHTPSLPSTRAAASFCPSACFTQPSEMTALISLN